MPIPKEKHLEHLNKRWINQLGDWIDHTVKHHNITIYSIAVILLAISIIGIFQIKATGSLIEDMPKKADFYKDIELGEPPIDESQIKSKQLELEGVTANDQQRESM